MQTPSKHPRLAFSTLCLAVLLISNGGVVVRAQTLQDPLPPPPAITPAMTPAAGSTLTPLAPLRQDPSVRIKDIAFVEGDRVNHVSGEGLVFGLSGTGGKSQQTRQMLTNYYLRRGVRVGQVDTKNISAVMVSGKIPAYARPGETILVTVSVADDASSLRGGTLNQTALRGIDDEIYAIAQGAIIGGGISAEGAGANVQKNHPTVGVCEAIVERAVPCGRIVNNGSLRLVLRNKSYSTATAIGNALNRIFPGRARALDSGTVQVFIPSTFANSVTEFISTIGNLRVEPDTPARVVINQKTGSIVLGHNVKIAPVLFASENIVIATTETPIASQPNPLAGGDTVVLPRTGIDLFESGGRYNVLPGGMTVGDLATALNSLAVSPTTLISIMTTLRNQGALKAELVIE
ncbi:Flagellar P-ring protein precursor [Stieleria neptunia]|uniref:Flagellar P-ring protein n=1 Tax=Stieleria neptunia TaxID=2527979 RepID=A0A518HTE5_9BACT|nr:flagellar basal body P-ring protein FlgI [Stieleria neptunia]QDV44135.1 Flagellar P-ring protein precursor [Stieleria neptunia]